MISKYVLKAGILFVFVICAVTLGCIAVEDNITEQASLTVKSERVLIPGGHSVGVRMDVRGVLVVGLEDILTNDGSTHNPGLEAGLEIGDTIIEVEGEKVYKADEVQRIVNEIQGDITLKVQRKDKIMTIHLRPVISADDGLYKLGVWIKDKTAGIGTLTFYDPETAQFGALGHGITDAETGVVLDVNEGELLNSRVESVKEGTAGKPGEIHGIFYESETPLGELVKNTEFGIFGNAYEPIDNSLYKEPLVVGMQEQVEEGPAYILSTIDGDRIEKFEIEIVRINPQTEPAIKSMIIEVTDERLLEETGGIVQGMSGSPIIQNDRIIGAVTHVMINSPSKGYGIFIEHMLEVIDE